MWIEKTSYKIDMEKMVKIQTLFSQIENLESSDSSTMTNPCVSLDLVKERFNIDYTYIDVCCGKGTFLINIYLELWDNIFDVDDIETKNRIIMGKIYGTDISESQVDISKGALKRLQRILGIKNILEPNIYNVNILEYDKNKLYELTNRKFTCVITNPPYNSERGENNQSVDIYPDIVDKAFELSDRYVIMITKSNWMNFPSHKRFREKMINGYNVDKIVHYQENPFEGTEIKGGVSYFVIDNQNTKEVFELNGVLYDRKVALDFLPYDLNKDELSLLDKILKMDKISLSNFRPQGYYKVKTNDTRLKSEMKDGGIICHVSEQKGKIQYISSLEINEKINNDLSKPKIITPSKYSPYKIGRLIKSNHGEICSESMVSWIFDNITDMELFYDYMNTKLFRVCFSLISNNARVGKTAFSLIPYIDFTKVEKVDDENIHKYLGLASEDIKTIEERCERLRLLR